MAYKSPRRIYTPRRKKVSIIKVLTISFLSISVFTFTVAFTLATKQLNKMNNLDIIDSENSSDTSNSSNLNNSNTGSQETESNTSEDSDSSGSESENVQANVSTPVANLSLSTIYNAPLPNTGHVSLNYLDDAAFLGDSITEGMKLHNMSEASIISATSMSTLGVISKPQAQYNNMTLVDALNAEKAKKIYIMLGSNEVGGTDMNVFISRYGSIIDTIKENNPEAIIYIQAIPPITKKYNSVSQYLTKDAIISANERILELAKEKKVIYLDIYSALADEEGFLPDEASPKDGIHFGAKYFQKWIQYLLDHTVPDDIAEQIINTK